jgi:hypothetical protein
MWPQTLPLLQMPFTLHDAVLEVGGGVCDQPNMARRRAGMRTYPAANTATDCGYIRVRFLTYPRSATPYPSSAEVFFFFSKFVPLAPSVIRSLVHGYKRLYPQFDSPPLHRRLGEFRGLQEFRV